MFKDFDEDFKALYILLIILESSILILEGFSFHRHHLLLLLLHCSAILSKPLQV